MKKAEVFIGEVSFEAEVAETLLEKARGLGGRKELAHGSAMLFEFIFSSFYPFTMRGMKFPIDIIYASEDMRIIDIKENCEPCASIFCKPIIPRKKAKYVLEINGGEAKKSGIHIGDRILVSPIPESKNQLSSGSTPGR